MATIQHGKNCILLGRITKSTFCSLKGWSILGRQNVIPPENQGINCKKKTLTNPQKPLKT